MICVADGVAPEEDGVILVAGGVIYMTDVVVPVTDGELYVAAGVWCMSYFYQMLLCL